MLCPSPKLEMASGVKKKKTLNVPVLTINKYSVSKTIPLIKILQGSGSYPPVCSGKSAILEVRVLEKGLKIRTYYNKYIA